MISIRMETETQLHHSTVLLIILLTASSIGFIPAVHRCVSVMCMTHLHVGMVCRVELLPQWIGTRPFTAISIVLFRENDPGAPSNLVEVDMHVNSSAEVLLLVLLLFVVPVILAAALLSFDSPQQLTLCTQEKFGALSCTQESRFVLLSILRALV